MFSYNIHHSSVPFSTVPLSFYSKFPLFTIFNPQLINLRSFEVSSFNSATYNRNAYLS